MEKMGEPIKACEIIYKVVVQKVLMYGTRILVVTDGIMTVLEGFHHSITRRIAVMTASKVDSVKW